VSELDSLQVEESWLVPSLHIGSSISRPRNLHQGHNCSSKLAAGMLRKSLGLTKSRSSDYSPQTGRLVEPGDD